MLPPPACFLSFNVSFLGAGVAGAGEGDFELDCSKWFAVAVDSLARLRGPSMMLLVSSPASGRFLPDDEDILKYQLLGESPPFRFTSSTEVGHLLSGPGCRRMKLRFDSRTSRLPLSVVYRETSGDLPPCRSLQSVIISQGVVGERARRQV